MFVELVDRLRCVRVHEDGWLVAASRRMSGRHIVEGVLGCPICRAEYPVRDAVADFRLGGRRSAEAAERAAGGVAPDRQDDDEVVRLAALLLLADVRDPVVLAGSWGRLASALVAVEPAAYLVVNPQLPVEERTELSALLADGAMPLADGSMHGVALDEAAAGDAGLLTGAVRVLRGGGRLVAPVATPLPEGVRELARDERHWVAEREATHRATAPVALRRARPA